METVNDDRIVLQVWHNNSNGTAGICGYVGEHSNGHWPLVATKQRAAKYTNMILAEGAANQYLAYLDVHRPERLKGSKIKYVRC